MPATRRTPLFWGLVIGGALTSLCCFGGLALTSLGLILDDGSAEGAAAAGEHVAGGFQFTPPPAFVADGPGRFKATQHDKTTVNTVEVILLPALAGRADAERKLQSTWNDVILRDWERGTPNPVVMRRFVGNGARAVFTGAELRGREGGLARVTLMLVDDDEQLRPVVFIQTSFDPEHLAVTQDQFARYTWGQSWALVENAIAGLRGSPTGAPLLDDMEVVGAWKFGSGSQLQWVNKFSGRSGMDVVSYSIQYEFTEDHRYTYKFSGASGTVGSLRFQGDSSAGEWRVKHDVLTLTSDEGKAVEYLLLGAPVSPEGKRLLYLLPRPHWVLEPSAAMANGELYVPRE